MDNPDELIERFLATGEIPKGSPGFSGGAAQRRERAEAVCRDVLVRVVAWRTTRAPIRSEAVPADAAQIVRTRIEPMLRGLFPSDEAEVLLERLPASVRVVTPSTFATLVQEVPPRRGWDLANLLLDAMGAPPLADDTPELDGLSHGAHCFVLPGAFQPPPPLGDVLVHEVAHVLHSVARGEVGLLPAEGPVLRVAPADRETFAWACELWAALERDPASRAERYASWCAGPAPEDARVDVHRLRAVLAAANAGAGWAAVHTIVGSSARWA